MQLQEYFEENGIQPTKAAALIDMSRQHLRLILQGRVTPSKRIARDISNFTKGHVSIEEIMSIRDNMLHKRTKCCESDNLIAYTENMLHFTELSGF